jgi:hypothetical protein
MRTISEGVSRRTRVAGASLPSSRRTSRKVSGKTDICKTFFNQESILNPQKRTTQAQRRGLERKLKDYDICNAGKPVNGGVCE